MKYSSMMVHSHLFLLQPLEELIQQSNEYQNGEEVNVENASFYFHGLGRGSIFQAIDNNDTKLVSDTTVPFRPNGIDPDAFALTILSPILNVLNNEERRESDEDDDCCIYYYCNYPPLAPSITDVPNTGLVIAGINERGETRALTLTVVYFHI
ncbi:MAG: hypothetical protein EZS28_006550 [Streblomastix strix]|uniref:Uncharacterized protein n=1 Tax=Streblomastix strix TaxID=222440 RepID=A0A5J4WS19_9EUKA|nr:MAG: hypothetical protein EZS28_006550 [Streblomastix strix]